MSQRGKRVQGGEVAELHGSVFGKAILQVGGKPLRFGRIARERQGKRRGIFHVAALGKLERAPGQRSGRA